MRPYFEEGGIAIYHGDCREIAPSLGPVDHMISDPPYSDTTHEGARTGGSLDTVKVLVNFASVTVDDVRAMIASADVRRWVVLTVDWQHVLPLKQQPPAGYRFIRHGAWVKPNGTPQFTGDRPAQGWEAVAILHREVRGRMRWNGGGLPAVWTHCKVAGLHPTGKPEPLLADFVTAFTEPGDLILDPFMGSGTTLVVAKRLGRRAIGIEQEERYCEVAAQRLRQGALDLFQSDPAGEASHTGTLTTRDLLEDAS